MKTKLFLLITMIISNIIYSETIVPGGPISGTWTETGSPYLIMGPTEVPNGLTLTIEPGVRVIWQGSHTMYIKGQILAQGTETDSITFTAADTTDGFNSIRFLDTPMENDTSRFEYCVFTYGRAHGLNPDNAGGAIGSMNFNKLIIDHCLFANNKALEINMDNPSGGAIALSGSSPKISNSIFINNQSYWGGAIICAYGSSPVIENNVFTNNSAVLNAGALICLAECDQVVIKNNLFYNNTSMIFSGAIEVSFGSSVQLINNTIANNHALLCGGGLLISTESNATIINTILWENSADSSGNQVYIYDETSDIDFYYCDIEGGDDDFGGIPFQGEYEENIDENPLFVNPENGDYCLAEESPCIDAGDPTMFDPDGTIIDIGAYYFDQFHSVVNDWATNPVNHILEIYPNPSSYAAHLRLVISDQQLVILDLYEISGMRIKPIMNEEMPAGIYEEAFEVSDLPAGIYFLKLQAGDEAEVVKLVIMK